MTVDEANDKDFTPSAVKQTYIQPRLLYGSPRNTSSTNESASVEEHHQFCINSARNIECIRTENWGLVNGRSRLYHGGENSSTNVTNHAVLPGLSLTKTSTSEPHCDSRRMSTTTELVEFFPKPVLQERTAREKQISDDRFCKDASKYCDIWNTSRSSPCFQTSNSGKYPNMWRPSKLECGTGEDEETQNSTSSYSHLEQTPQEQNISPVSYRLSLQDAKELVAKVPSFRSYLSSTSVVFPSESGERNDAILMASESVKPKRKCSSALHSSKRFYTTGDNVVGLQPFLYVGVVINSEHTKEDRVNPKDNTSRDPQKDSSAPRSTPGTSNSRGDRITIKAPWNPSTKIDRNDPPRYEPTPYPRPNYGNLPERASQAGWNFSPKIDRDDPQSLRASTKYDDRALDSQDFREMGGVKSSDIPVSDQNIPDKPPKIPGQEPNSPIDTQWHTNYNSRKSRTRKAVKAEVGVEGQHEMLEPATTHYTEYAAPENKQISEIHNSTVESLSAKHDLGQQRLNVISTDTPAHENKQIPTENDKVVQEPGIQMGIGKLRTSIMQLPERVDRPVEIQSILYLPSEDELMEHPVTEESRKGVQMGRNKNVPDSVVDPSEPQTASIKLKTVPGRLSETAKTSTEPGSKKSDEPAYHSDTLSQKVRESIRVKQDDVIVRELPPENTPATPHAPMTSISEAVQVPEDTEPTVATIIPLEDLATYPISLPASVTSYLKPNRKTTLIVTQNDKLVEEIRKRPNTISGIPSVLPEAVKQPINYGPSYGGVSPGSTLQYFSMVTTPMCSEVGSNPSYSVARRTSACIMLSVGGKVQSTSSEDLRHSPAVLSQPVEFKPVSTKLSSSKDVQPAEKPATNASEGILTRPTDQIGAVSAGIGQAQGLNTRSPGGGVTVTTVPKDPHTPLASPVPPNLIVSSPAIQDVPAQVNKPPVSAVPTASGMKEPVDSPHSETIRTENEHFPLPMTTSPTPPPVLDPTVDQVESYADSEYASEAPPATVDTDLNGLQSPLNEALVHNTKPIPVEGRPNQLNNVSNMHIRPSREPNNYSYAQGFQNQQTFGPHYPVRMPGVDMSLPHSVPVHSTMTNQPPADDVGAARVLGQIAGLPAYSDGSGQNVPRSLQTRKTREQVSRRITWDWKRDFVPATDGEGSKAGQEIGSMEMKDAFEILKETSLLTEGFQPQFSLGEHPSVLINLPNNPRLNCEMKVGDFTEIKTKSNADSPDPRGGERPDQSESSEKKRGCMSFKKKSRRKSTA